MNQIIIGSPNKELLDLVVATLPQQDVELVIMTPAVYKANITAITNLQEGTVGPTQEEIKSIESQENEKQECLQSALYYQQLLQHKGDMFHINDLFRALKHSDSYETVKKSVEKLVAFGFMKQDIVDFKKYCFTITNKEKAAFYSTQLATTLMIVEDLKVAIQKVYKDEDKDGTIEGLLSMKQIELLINPELMSVKTELELFKKIAVSVATPRELMEDPSLILLAPEEPTDWDWIDEAIKKRKESMKQEEKPSHIDLKKTTQKIILPGDPNFKI